MAFMTIKQCYANDGSVPKIKFDTFKYEPDGLTKFYKDGILVGKIKGKQYTTIEFNIPIDFMEADLDAFKEVIQEMIDDL